MTTPATDTAISEVTPSKGRKQPEKVRGVFERPKGSGAWWICYFDNGQKRREKVGRRQDAIDLYQIRKADIRRGVQFPVASPVPVTVETVGVTIGELIDGAQKWYQSHRPKSVPTVKGQLAAIKAGLGDRSAETLTAGDVDKWIASPPEWTPATTDRYQPSPSCTF
jgi:hypothetical protein